MVKKVSKKPSAKTKKVKKSTGPVSKPSAGKKKVAKKTTKKVTTGTVERKRPAGVDFPAGTDMAVVWEQVKKGGESRHEVLENCRQAFNGQTTTSGNPKPVSTILNQVLSRAKEAGYVIKQSWKVIPGDGVKAAPSKKDDSTKKAVKKAAKPTAKGKKVVKKK